MRTVADCREGPIVVELVPPIRTDCYPRRYRTLSNFDPDQIRTWKLAFHCRNGDRGDCQALETGEAQVDVRPCLCLCLSVSVSVVCKPVGNTHDLWVCGMLLARS